MAKYTVRKGDNLTVIAKRYGTTVDELVRLNGIEDPNKDLCRQDTQRAVLDSDAGQAEIAVEVEMMGWFWLLLLSPAIVYVLGYLVGGGLQGGP